MRDHPCLWCPGLVGRLARIKDAYPEAWADIVEGTNGLWDSQVADLEDRIAVAARENQNEK